MAWDKEAKNAYQRKWRQDNRAKLRATDPAQYKINRDKEIDIALRYLYGITLAERDAMLVAQDNRCAICRSEDPGNKHGWYVDHDHTTGTVRGILCHPCNHGLGGFKDNQDNLAAAILYLQKSEVV